MKKKESRFTTQYMENKRVNTCIGSKVHKLYSSRYTDEGELELFEVGAESIPDLIQSHAESVDINVILEKYREGDTSALQRRQALYGDFTLMPKTYAEALNLALQGEEYFMSLPLEVREKYDHNFAKFLASLDHVTAESGDGSSEPETAKADDKRSASSEEGVVEK